MNWLYQGVPVVDDIAENYVGFVYLITNLQSGKKYIGKKLLKKTRTKKALAGKTRKRKVVTESDWKDYYGSNKDLIEEAKSIGKDKFKREILRLCTSKGEVNYYEAKYQFEYGVLESDDWYNNFIMVRVHSSHLKKSLTKPASV